MSELEQYTYISDSLRNSDSENGWGFNQGDPEFWKFQRELVVPSGKLLDFGAGTGRSCLYFAVQGMQVTACESSPKNADQLRELAGHSGLPITVMESDFRTADLGENEYDTIIIDSTLIHASSSEEAFAVLDKAVKALKIGGCMFVRALGTEDQEYAEMQIWGSPQGEHKNVYTIPCECSGELKEEPLLFLNQTDLVQYCALKNMEVVHSQCMPEYGRVNVMYGEDWQFGMSTYKTNGLITIIARKLV